MSSNTAISIEDVNKGFTINRDKSNTIRGVVGSMLHKKSSETNHQTALKDINFKIDKGDFFGVVGRNGSGKSTLLKIIAGIYQPTSGKVVVNGQLVPFIELGVGFNPELSARENVFLNGAMLGFSRREVEGFYDTVVEFAELPDHMDKKLKNFSSGMQVRLAFSIAIQADADILLIDEVLAVGDASFKKKCYDFFESLKDNHKTVVFVTHDMSAITKYCNKAVLIDEHKVVTKGSPTKVAAAYQELFVAKTSKPKKRRSDQAVCEYFEKPVASVNNKTISITASLRVHQPVDYINAGFSLSRVAGGNLLGTNTDIVNQRIIDAKVGDTYTMRWSFPNVLQNGEYFIHLAAVSKDGTVKYDWWNEAGVFKVQGKTQTPYPLALDTKLQLSRKNNLR